MTSPANAEHGGGDMRRENVGRTILLRELRVREPGEFHWDIKQITDNRQRSWARGIGQSFSSSIIAEGLKSKDEGQGDEEIYHGPSSHGTDPGHVGMAGRNLWWTLFTPVISFITGRSVKGAAILYHRNMIAEGRISDVDTAGHFRSMYRPGLTR
jgi:hypothetical protein